MKKVNVFQGLRSSILAISLLVTLQGIDYGYFAFLHPGLKFPDYFLIMFLSIFFGWKYIIRRPLSELLGIDIYNKKFIISEFFRGVLYGCILILFVVGFGIISQSMILSYNPDFAKNIVMMLIGYLVFIPISALYEELHYRGLYITLFKGKYTRLIAILVSSIIFSWVHIQFRESYTIYYPVNMLLFALILSLLRLRYKNIIFLVGVHAAWNFFPYSSITPL